MVKSLFGLLLAACLLAGCAASPQSVETRSIGAGQSLASTSLPAAPAEDQGSYRTVYVPPQVGSHLGGGYVRVPIENLGNDESALIATIIKLNAAGGEKRERQFVIEAVSRSTGVSQRELQAQQDILRLRFGDLCAINAIARGNSEKVQQIATLRSKGTSWTQLASANGVSIATVAQTTRNADQLTVSSFSNSVDRANGGPDRLKNMGIHPQPNVRPGG
jgi:uncharacterized protein YerC